MNDEEEQQKSFGDFEQAEEEAAKPVVPKKPLTESDLLSGFMSAFGSNV